MAFVHARGRIKLDRRVDIPQPRHYSVKTMPVFMELKAELTEQVRVEVREAQAQTQAS
jgi:NitT/TauT family transport system ATP-binding protein